MRPEYITAVRDGAAKNDQKAWQFVEQAVIKALKEQDAWHFVERAIKAQKSKKARFRRQDLCRRIQEVAPREQAGPGNNCIRATREAPIGAVRPRRGAKSTSD